MKMDIIIPFHGQTELLYQCVARLADGLRIDGNVYLVDDATDIEESELASEKIGSLNLPVQWLRLPRRSGFVNAVNTAWKKATQPFSLILNNDVLPTSDLVRKIYDIFGDFNRVAAVSPQSDNPSDLYQYRPDETPVKEKRSNLSGSEIRLVPYLTAMCLGVRRRAVKGVLFDEIYSPGYFEDLDLSCRLRVAGWQLAVIEACKVTHIGRATFGLETSLSDIINRNYATFAQRWSHLSHHRELYDLLAKVETKGVNL